MSENKIFDRLETKWKDGFLEINKIKEVRFGESWVWCELAEKQPEGKPQERWFPNIGIRHHGRIEKSKLPQPPTEKNNDCKIQEPEPAFTMSDNLAEYETEDGRKVISYGIKSLCYSYRCFCDSDSWAVNKNGYAISGENKNNIIRKIRDL